MWFSKNFIQRNLLKGLLCLSYCYAEIPNTSILDDSPMSNDYLDSNVIKKIESNPQKFDSIPLVRISNYDLKEKIFSSELYRGPILEAFLERREKEIDKEERLLGEAVDVEEQKQKKKYNKLREEIIEARQFIENKNKKQKEEFDQAAQNLENEKDDPKKENIMKFFESFVAYLQFARKSDVLSIQKQTKEQADSNQLAQVQRKFTQYIGKILDFPEDKICKIVWDLLKNNEDNARIRNLFNCVLYTPAWEEETQLKLLEHINKLKDVTIRCGFGLVHEGIADSNGIIPIISSRFYGPFRNDMIRNFTYGFNDKFRYDNNLKRVSYPDTLKIGENSLKIFPKVLEAMKTKDEEWYKFDKYYDSKFFKSGFGLAKVRELLAWIYQKHFYIYAQIIKNFNQFKNPKEFLEKAILENSLFALQGIVFSSLRALILPIEIFDRFLYMFKQ